MAKGNDSIRDTVRDDLNLAIDEDNLINEWRGQASMMLDYGILLADAMQEEDEAKARLAVVAAELDKEIRNDPEAFGLIKATESTVPNAIVEQPEHMVALKKLNKARYKVRVYRAAVDAIGHRKSALQGMTDLFLRQWFADPKSSEQPVELREAANAGPPTKTISRKRKRRFG